VTSVGVPRGRRGNYEGMTARNVVVAVFAAALTPVLAPASAQAVPKLPSSTANTKKCSTTQRLGYTVRVFITQGKSTSCKRARYIMSRSPLRPFSGYRYYD